MSGLVGDSGDTWGLCPLSPGWTLMDKALTPLGTRDGGSSGRQANAERCPCCPRSLRRHPCPFASLEPMRLYHLVNERLRLLIPGTAETKSSPIVPTSGPDGCQRGKPAANAPALLRGRRPATLYPHRKAGKRRRAPLWSPHAAPSCIAPPFPKVGPRSRKADRDRRFPQTRGTSGGFLTRRSLSPANANLSGAWPESLPRAASSPGASWMLGRTISQHAACTTNKFPYHDRFESAGFADRQFLRPDYRHP